MIANITSFIVTSGSKPSTAQYGSCVIFNTDIGEKLYWDTNSKAIYKIIEFDGKPLKKPFKISFKEIDSVGKIKNISHVKFL